MPARVVDLKDIAEYSHEWQEVPQVSSSVDFRGWSHRPRREVLQCNGVQVLPDNLWKRSYYFMLALNL